MKGTDRFIISPDGALWFGSIAGRGGGTGLIKAVNLFFAMDHFFDRNVAFC